MARAGAELLVHRVVFLCTRAPHLALATLPVGSWGVPVRGRQPHPPFGGHNND